MSEIMPKRDADAVLTLLKTARTEGIIAGLEMAEKFLSLTKDRKEVVSMIEVAIMTARSR